MDPKFVDDLAQRLSQAVPEGLRSLQAEAERNFKVVLQSALGRLDLVTREEFDVQTGVLRRTREKLKAMEERVQALEGLLADEQ